MTPILTELQYAKTPGAGPWRLYIFDRDGYHRGGKFFHHGPLPSDPSERPLWVSAEFAREDATSAFRQGLEVRITDGGDRLVFHAKGGRQIFPADPQTFWDVVGAR